MIVSSASPEPSGGQRQLPTIAASRVVNIQAPTVSGNSLAVSVLTPGDRRANFGYESGKSALLERIGDSEMHVTAF